MLQTARLLKLSNNLLQLDFELLNSIVKSIIINDKISFFKFKFEFNCNVDKN